MLDLLDHFDWTYISLLYADELYGYGARSALKQNQTAGATAMFSI